MRSLQLQGQSTVACIDVPTPEPGPGEVLVKMMASGVCHSDWHVVKGEWTHHALPALLGHEGAGVVTDVGDGVTHVVPGDHVIIAFSPPCGTCPFCTGRNQPKQKR